jgi:general secretion pathway protein K
MVTRLKKSERGVALLAVLLGIALMTLIVVDFAMSAGVGFVSAANQANGLRAYYLARSGISIGLALIAQDTRLDATSQTPAVDTLNDSWAIPLPPIQVDGGAVAVTVVDEARKLSINSLIDGGNGNVNKIAVERMERLFVILGVDPAILPAIVDWIDPNSENSAGGTEAEYYMGLKPPYQPRNGPMPTIGDLQMVKGVNEATFNRLRPFLTVMVEKVPNANTASPQVLASLEPQMTEDPKLVEAIVAARSMRPFTATTDIANLPELGTIGTKVAGEVTRQSENFTISGMGSYAGSRKLISAVFHREKAGNGSLASWQED